MSDQYHTVRGYQLIGRDKRLMTSAMEDYLEMICRNCESQGFVRMNRLAELLHVRASSATKMVQKLGALGLLKYERYGIVTLTDSGRKMGEYLLTRHRIIEDFLRAIGIREDLLTETELIEHTISARTLERIHMLNRYLSKYPDIADGLREYGNACGKAP